MAHIQFLFKPAHRLFLVDSEPDGAHRAVRLAQQASMPATSAKKPAGIHSRPRAEKVFGVRFAVPFDVRKTTRLRRIRPLIAAVGMKVVRDARASFGVMMSDPHRHLVESRAAPREAKSRPGPAPLPQTFFFRFFSPAPSFGFAAFSNKRSSSRGLASLN